MKKYRSSDKPKSILRRILDLGVSGEGERTIADLSRKELQEYVVAMHQENTALHQELTKQQERANEALRVLSGFYDFSSVVVTDYIVAANQYREDGNKPVPVMWLAARICEFYEMVFETFKISDNQMGPDKQIVKALYAIAKRELNRGSKLSEYLYPELVEQVDEIQKD